MRDSVHKFIRSVDFLVLSFADGVQLLLDMPLLLIFPLEGDLLPMGIKVIGLLFHSGAILCDFAVQFILLLCYPCIMLSCLFIHLIDCFALHLVNFVFLPPDLLEMLFNDFLILLLLLGHHASGFLLQNCHLLLYSLVDPSIHNILNRIPEVERQLVQLILPRSWRNRDLILILSTLLVKGHLR